MNDTGLCGLEFHHRGLGGVIVVGSWAVSEGRGDCPTHSGHPLDTVSAEWRCLAPHSPQVSGGTRRNRLGPLGFEPRTKGL
jgi:hypothetical protein